MYVFNKYNYRELSGGKPSERIREETRIKCTTNNLHKMEVNIDPGLFKALR